MRACSSESVTTLGPLAEYLVPSVRVPVITPEDWSTVAVETCLSDNLVRNVWYVIWEVLAFWTRLGTMRTASTTTMTTTERMMRFLFCPGESWPGALGDGPLGALGFGGVTSSCYAPRGRPDASPPTVGPGTPPGGAVGIVGE